jgi:hypothetical protein
MNWFYESGGQQQGPVSESELDRLLAEGKINANSLVWREGMADWQPLRTARPGVLPVPPAIPSGEASETSAGQVRCAATGKLIPESEAIWINGLPYSPEARPGASIPPVPSASQSIVQADDALRDGPAWEQRNQIGWLRAIGETISGVLLQPGATFARMRRTGGIGTPLLYFMLLGYVGSAIALFYQIFFERLSPGALSQMAAAERATPDVSPTVQFVGALIALLFILPLGSFVQSGILHLSLMIFGGARKGFETTYRVGCYVWGTVAIFYLLPVCGQFVAVVWGIVAMIIGLTAAHETDTGRAVGAVFLPMAVCCVIAIAFSGLVLAALHGAMQNQ